MSGSKGAARNISIEEEACWVLFNTKILEEIVLLINQAMQRQQRNYTIKARYVEPSIIIRNRDIYEKWISMPPNERIRNILDYIKSSFELSDCLEAISNSLEIPVLVCPPSIHGYELLNA
ncbi:hypothetical protein ILUMI_02598 [Ignelater luminosus]|uniref:Uncharacterized protein n=1 Tax=Ignelater luminosus TaxID=2038154 RepID=A0A8K0DCF8_IGNLU|nr:hypothetical protein ILUMI_02598 [Ignelater luminosus]